MSQNPINEDLTKLESKSQTNVKLEQGSIKERKEIQVWKDEADPTNTLSEVVG